MLEPKRKFNNPWLALFLLWALIRVFITEGVGDFVGQWFNFWLSSAGFIYVFAGILLFYTVYCHAEDPSNYLTPILIVCVMNFILVIAQMLGHDFVWKHAPSICGFFAISSQLGQYSAMSLPVLAFISPWLAIIPIVTLYLSNSISSIVALSVGVIFWSWQKRIKWALLLLIIPLLIGCFNYRFIVSKLQHRLVTWEKILKVSLKKPYVGYGYRSFDEVIVQKQYNRPHNDPIHTIQEMGFPAMIFIGGFFVGLWKKFKTKQDKDKLTYLLATSVLISVANMCGQSLIRYASIAGTFIIMLAFLSIKIKEVKNNGSYI